MARGKEFSAAFVDEGYHIAVLVEGEWRYGATPVGVNVLDRECLTAVGMEWGSGFLADKTAGACEAWWWGHLRVAMYCSFCGCV